MCILSLLLAAVCPEQAFKGTNELQQQQQLSRPPPHQNHEQRSASSSSSSDSAAGQTSGSGARTPDTFPTQRVQVEYEWLKQHGALVSAIHGFARCRSYGRQPLRGRLGSDVALSGGMYAGHIRWIEQVVLLRVSSRDGCSQVYWGRLCSQLGFAASPSKHALSTLRYG